MRAQQRRRCKSFVPDDGLVESAYTGQDGDHQPAAIRTVTHTTRACFGLIGRKREDQETRVWGNALRR
jgi:hypothetical protein